MGYIPGSVSPPWMHLSYEEEIPILFSQLIDHEDDSNNQPGEHFEEDSQENENNNCDSTSSFNEIPLGKANYQNVEAASSWESSELDDQSDIEDGECSPSP